jgi:hypothetical protein
MTAIAIVVSGAWTTVAAGAEPTQVALRSAMPRVGDENVAHDEVDDTRLTAPIEAGS